jgi:hypothetical protein
MTQTKPAPEPQPKRGPSPMQPEMEGVTSVRQFFAILFNKHRKSKK